MADDAPPGRPGLAPVLRSATAPALLVEESPPVPEERPRVGPRRVTELPKVAAKPEAQGTPSPQGVLPFGPLEVRATPRATRQPPSPARRRHDASQQQALPLEPEAPAVSRRSRYLDAPTAQPGQRAVAAAIDLFIPVLGFAVFHTAMQMWSGGIAVNGQTSAFYAVATAIFALLYRALCCFGDMDTLGVQWAGLRLVDEDGRRPTRRARFIRTAGGILSAMPAGIGLWWALTEDNSRTWHDLMSGTYPTQRLQ